MNNLVQSVGDSNYSANSTEEDDNKSIISNTDGTFSLELHIPKLFHKHILGSNEHRQLEADTKTKITVPPTAKSNQILISGQTSKAVIECKKRIDNILKNAREKEPFTHFNSIPMNTNEIQENFNKFKSEILNMGDIRGVVPSLFQIPVKLHITIGTMLLADEKEIHQAATVLQTLQKSVLKLLIDELGQLRIVMKGLECMNDDPTKAHILYAKVEMENDKNNVLQKICDTLIDYLVEKDLTVKEYEHVTLHVTLLNTLFSQNVRRKTFDATPILRKFENYYFGVVDFNQIHISSKQREKSKYYQHAYILSF